MKAKVDTGAKTSAIHATAIEPFQKAGQQWVRFRTAPNPDLPTFEVDCAAPVVDRRTVTSSNGVSEERPVIGTRVEMGDQSWPVEVTLTDRGTMTFRMLLGRSSIPSGWQVDPAQVFLQPTLDYTSYGSAGPASGSVPGV